MGDDQKRQERTELLQATAELLSGLAPIHEREEPEVLGKRTAIYLNGDVWRSAVKAYERAGAVLNRLRIRDADFVPWSRLYSLSVLAKHLTGTADDGDDIRVTHCLYELLEDAADEARETMHADTSPGADRSACMHNVPGCTCIEDVAKEAAAAADAEEAVAMGTTATVEQIRRQAVGLCTIGEAVMELDAPDPDLLDLLRERVGAAARLVWQIESWTKPADQPAGWGRLADVSRLGDTLTTAAVALGEPGHDVPTISEEVLPHFAAWRPPACLAIGVGRELQAWAEEVPRA